MLRRIRRDFQVTIVLITHELDAVRALCDRVAVLEKGQIAEEGPVEKVLLQPESAAAKRLVHRDYSGLPFLTPTVGVVSREDSGFVP